ncbi:MAG TPA: anaerobic ribonucleoside-triphosphate reductase activating protein [Candidatus Rikenella faecigallinarum]|uniref:Anaerobic ribonucleoside-triphosphate reductase activating protein n=1 Tax=Candidatus Rikenella faecigallinarum TaxID=2838745 RepID=A0A9D1QBY5_9BACT|nr:anaerobic ribonucleoside-triphosphate reductase activating protein [Candidatus Rikenella faecigallinarum]
MRIGGFLKQSLIDWEGRLVAVVFTKGCNFRCGYCHNPSLVIPRLVECTPDIPSEAVLTYLKARRHWLDGVVVSGGEPTLQPDLVQFLERVQQLGLAVKLDTNGTHPEVLTELFWKKLVNFVALDVKHFVTQEDYARVTPTVTEAQVEAVRQTLALLREHPEVERQLRTTLIPGVHAAELSEALSALFAPQTIRFQTFREGDLVRDYL